MKLPFILITRHSILSLGKFRQLEEHQYLIYCITETCVIHYLLHFIHIFLTLIRILTISPCSATLSYLVFVISFGLTVYDQINIIIMCPILGAQIIQA